MSKKTCPNCGRTLNSLAFNCGFCGYSFGSSNRSNDNNSYNYGFKRCPECGTMLRENKKLCPKCNYNFKKSKVDKPKINKHKTNKPKINKPIIEKHFDDGIVSFVYPDIYSKDFNSKYHKIGILASFKIGSSYNIDSSFAVFQGESISNDIPDSKFKEVIKKSLDADVLELNRYSFEEKERIIIKTHNRTNGNIEYYCYVPEIGFSALFIIPNGKEYLFDENYISTVVNSLEKSSGEFLDINDSSSVVNSSEESITESFSEKEIKICTNCGTENTNDSNFCMECGMKLDISDDVNFCIHCGTEIVHGAKFCMNCGKLIDY